MRIENSENCGVGLAVNDLQRVEKNLLPSRSGTKSGQNAHLRRRLVAQKWLLAILLGSTAVLTDGAPAAAADASSSVIETVTVTARKESETLIDAPVAVQFLAGDQLQRAGITDLTGLTEEVPQLHLANFFSGSGSSVAIRGIGSPITDVGVESTVSMVFDGVQTSRGLLGQLGLFDVDNIQVLKGPQALFFGKNSPGGVISVNSKAPTDTWQGDAKAGYEFNAVEPSFEGAVGGPLTDTLKIRVSAKYDRMDGYMTNNAQPQTYPNPFAFIPGAPATFSVLGGSSRSAPDNQDLVGRIVLEWTPSDNFSAILHVMAGQLKNDGANAAEFVTICQSGAHPFELGLQSPTGGCGIGAATSVNQVLPTTVNGHVPFQDFTGELNSLQLNYNVGDLAFTSTTGYAHFNSHIFDTDDGLLALFNDASSESLSQFSEEFRVRSSFDFPVNFMAGIYYENSSHPFAEEVWFFSGLLPVNPTTGDFSGSFVHSFTHGSTYSPFAQALWKISDDLELDVGVRYTHETIRNTQFNSITNPYLPIFGLNLLPVGVTLSGSESFSNTSPEATLTWHPAEDMMAYAAFKTGYKSGGFSTPGDLIAPPTATDADFTFKPEKSYGGEVGFRGQFLEHTLQVTATLYDYRFQNLQESEFNAPTLSFSTQNAASARTRGVESDILWKPVPDLTLHASLNYNEGRFIKFTNGPCYAGQTTGCTLAGTQDLSGTRLPYSSDWTEIAGFTWDRSVASDYRLTLGSNVQYLSPLNSSATRNPLANYGPIWLLGANLGIYSTDSDSWRLELSGRNLLNQHYMTVSIDRVAATDSVGGTVTDQYGPINRPREIWLQLTKNFGD